MDRPARKRGLISVGQPIARSVLHAADARVHRIGTRLGLLPIHCAAQRHVRAHWHIHELDVGRHRRIEQQVSAHRADEALRRHAGVHVQVAHRQKSALRGVSPVAERQLAGRQVPRGAAGVRHLGIVQVFHPNQRRGVVAEVLKLQHHAPVDTVCSGPARHIDAVVAVAPHLADGREVGQADLPLHQQVVVEFHQVGRHRGKGAAHGQKTAACLRHVGKGERQPPRPGSAEERPGVVGPEHHPVRAEVAGEQQVAVGQRLEVAGELVVEQACVALFPAEIARLAQGEQHHVVPSGIAARVPLSAKDVVRERPVVRAWVAHHAAEGLPPGHVVRAHPGERTGGRRHGGETPAIGIEGQGVAHHEQVAVGGHHRIVPLRGNVEAERPLVLPLRVEARHRGAVRGAGARLVAAQHIVTRAAAQRFGETVVQRGTVCVLKEGGLGCNLLQ